MSELPITEHFTIAEWACHDGTPFPIGTIDEEDPAGRTWMQTRLLPQALMLEVIRQAAIDQYGLTPAEAAIIIISGFRTISHDQAIYDAHIAALAAKGLPNDHLVAEPTSSEHPRGRAADVRHVKLPPHVLFNLVIQLFQAGKLPQLGGIGLYPDFVHLDVRKRQGSTGGANDGHLAIWGASRPSNVA
jgi:hypothetical protein